MASAFSISVYTTTNGIGSYTCCSKVDMAIIKGIMSVAMGRPMVKVKPKEFSEATGSTVLLNTFWRAPIRVCLSSCTVDQANGFLDTASVDSHDGCIVIMDLLGEELSEASDNSNLLISQNLEGGNLAIWGKTSRACRTSRRQWSSWLLL